MVLWTAAVGGVQIHSQNFSMWTSWNGLNTWLTNCSDRKQTRKVTDLQLLLKGHQPRQTCSQQCKLTTQVRVTAGLLAPDLNEKLIFPALRGRHMRARHGVTLWERPFSEENNLIQYYICQKVYEIQCWKFVLTTAVLWTARKSAVTNHQPVSIITRWSFTVTDGHVAF